MGGAFEILANLESSLFYSVSNDGSFEAAIDMAGALSLCS